MSYPGRRRGESQEMAEVRRCTQEASEEFLQDVSRGSLEGEIASDGRLIHEGHGDADGPDVI